MENTEKRIAISNSKFKNKLFLIHMPVLLKNLMNMDMLVMKMEFNNQIHCWLKKPLHLLAQ